MNGSIDNNKVLKRKELIEIVDEFYKSHPRFSPSNPIIEPKEILKTLNEIRNRINEVKFYYEDYNFFTCGRRDALKKEFYSFFKDQDMLDKGINFVYYFAFKNLTEYIECDVWVNKRYGQEVVEKSEQYKNKGIICEQEKDIILEIISEFEKRINEYQSIIINEDIKRNLFDKKKNVIVKRNYVPKNIVDPLFHVIDNVIEKKESLFISSSGEEILNIYYDIFVNNNYKVLIINLEDCNKSECWNPLMYPYELYKRGYKEKAIYCLGRTLKIMSCNKTIIGKENSLVDFVIGIIVAMFENASKDEISFASLYNIINKIDLDDIFNDTLIMYLKDKKNIDIYNLVSPVLSMPIDIINIILFDIREKLKSFEISQYSNIVNKTTYDINKTRPIVFFFISKLQDDNSSDYFSMFIDQLHERLIDLKHEQFNFILDNFDFNKNIFNLVQNKFKFYLFTNSINNIPDLNKNVYSYYCDVLDINDFIQQNNNVLFPKYDNKEKRIFKFKRIEKAPVFDSSKAVSVFDIKKTEIDDLIEKLDNMNKKENY